jgi:hypothetical protein
MKYHYCHKIEGPLQGYVKREESDTEKISSCLVAFTGGGAADCVEFPSGNDKIHH